MDEAGVWRAGLAILEEAPGRVWISGWPTVGMTGFHLRPLIREFRLLARLGIFHEARAWIVHQAEMEERFASAFGFRLDCGPATGLSPSGQDLNLWLWRAGDEQHNGR